MGLRGRLNHRVSVYRPVGARDRFGDTVVAPDAPVYTDVPCYQYRPRITEHRDVGPGNTEIGHHRVFFEPSIDIRMNDILVFTAGPNTGLKLKAIGDPDNRVGHHLEVTADAYYGPLPEGV